MSVPLDLVARLVQERYIISLFHAIRQNWLLTCILFRMAFDRFSRRFFIRKGFSLSTLNVTSILKSSAIRLIISLARSSLGRASIHFLLAYVQQPICIKTFVILLREFPRRHNLQGHPLSQQNLHQ